ncbi:phosphotransferase enzyme family protein [Plantactinospora sonchi]|uniref:Phosphotransferase n=1 Tax=Plantactinospora sonchi TaxID=1544735 RepID=A0ABU7RN40_9ACTN
MIEESRLRACLVDRWGLSDPTVEVHNGGMNSATWFVGQGGRRWVAKAVPPAGGAAFTGGLRVSGRVEAAGIAAGAPVPARDGDLVTWVDQVPLALLTWVPGVELDGQRPEQQRLIGTTLARVHRALRDAVVDGAETFHWVVPGADHLTVRPWVRDAVTAGVAAYDNLGPGSLSWGLLHTDPAPEAFRLDRTTGACGLIDWSVAMRGPLLYDLASAAMYVGGPEYAGELVGAYLAGGVLSRTEVDRGLLPMLRFRWAVQADYFARRISVGDLTGIGSAADNEAGLADARHWLGRLCGRIW